MFAWLILIKGSSCDRITLTKGLQTNLYMGSVSLHRPAMIIFNWDTGLRWLEKTALHVQPQALSILRVSQAWGPQQSCGFLGRKLWNWQVWILLPSSMANKGCMDRCIVGSGPPELLSQLSDSAIIWRTQASKPRSFQTNQCNQCQYLFYSPSIVFQCDGLWWPPSQTIKINLIEIN